MAKPDNRRDRVITAAPAIRTFVIVCIILLVMCTADMVINP